MATEKKPKPENNGRMLTFLTLYCLLKYAMADGKARVTGALMFCNHLTYFRKPGLIANALLPTIDQVWFNFYRFLKHKEQKRFYFSPFYHSRRNHFVYDMLKLLWNGVELEPKLGGLDYATMFGFLVFVSQKINYVVRYLAMLAGQKWIFVNEELVGCTNVIFALDYIRNAMREGDRYILGYRVPRYLSPWIELIVAKTVGAGDFLGNLGGVLTGIVYLQLKTRKRGPDPIAEIIRTLFGLRPSDDNSENEDPFTQYERERELAKHLRAPSISPIEEAYARINSLATYGELPRGGWVQCNGSFLWDEWVQRQDRPRIEIQLSDIESGDEEEYDDDEGRGNSEVARL